jgi:hypothetical protein
MAFHPPKVAFTSLEPNRACIPPRTIKRFSTFTCRKRILALSFLDVLKKAQMCLKKPKELSGYG